MRVLTALMLFALAACSRPLSDAEEQFAADLFGDTLDTSKVTVSQGVGVRAPATTVPVSVQVVHGKDKACVPDPQPRTERPQPLAFALFNRLHFDDDFYSSDLALGWQQGGLRVPHGLVLAHELTHVWQWQNRAETGYTPAAAVAESLQLTDPYFFRPGEEPSFFAFGYEQQATIVEEFVCFTVANPNHPRRQELRALLEPHFPVAQFEAAVGR